MATGTRVRVIPLQHTENVYQSAPPGGAATWAEFGCMFRPLDQQLNIFEQHILDAIKKENQLVAPQLDSSNLGLYNAPIRVDKVSDNDRDAHPRVVLDTDGKKRLQMAFNLHHFRPDRVRVQIIENKLIMHAHNEEKSEAGVALSQMSRQFTIPEGVNPESIKSEYTRDCYLVIQADLPETTPVQTVKLPPLPDKNNNDPK